MQEPGSMAPVAQILTPERRTNSRQHTPCTLVRLIRTHDDREPTAVTMDRTASNVCATNMDVICSPTALARKSSGGLALDSLLTRRSQSQACVVEGADSEYTSTYGVNAQGNQLSSGYVTQGPYSKSVGSRTYLMDSQGRYKMFKLKKP